MENTKTDKSKFGVISPFCTVCLNFGNIAKKDCYGHIPGKHCPTLAIYECPNCHEKGHTRKHCNKSSNSKGGGGKKKIFCTVCLKFGGKEEKDCYGHVPGEHCPTLAEHTCSNCHEKGHTKKHCTISSSFCTICFKFGGFEREDCYGHTPGDDCPTLAEYECPNCNEKGHTKKHCDKPIVISCKFCKEKGHEIDDCEVLRKRNEDREKSNASKYCSFCGEHGHTARYCDSPYNARNNSSDY